MGVFGTKFDEKKLNLKRKIIGRFRFRKFFWNWMINEDTVFHFIIGKNTPEKRQKHNDNIHNTPKRFMVPSYRIPLSLTPSVLHTTDADPEEIP